VSHSPDFTISHLIYSVKIQVEYTTVYMFPCCVLYRGCPVRQGVPAGVQPATRGQRDRRGSPGAGGGGAGSRPRPGADTTQVYCLMCYRLGQRSTKTSVLFHAELDFYLRHHSDTASRSMLGTLPIIRRQISIYYLSPMRQLLSGSKRDFLHNGQCQVQS